MQIFSVTPNNSPAAGGSTVTIIGTDLDTATGVQFGLGNDSPSFIVSDQTFTVITAQVPESPQGTAEKVHVFVITPDGDCQSPPFTYTA